MELTGKIRRCPIRDPENFQEPQNRCKERGQEVQERGKDKPKTQSCRFLMNWPINTGKQMQNSGHALHCVSIVVWFIPNCKLIPWMKRTKMPRNGHCIELNCIVLAYLALHYIAWHYFAWHYIAWHYIAWYYFAWCDIAWQ